MSTIDAGYNAGASLLHTAVGILGHEGAEVPSATGGAVGTIVENVSTSFGGILQRVARSKDDMHLNAGLRNLELVQPDLHEATRLLQGHDAGMVPSDVADDARSRIANAVRQLTIGWSVVS